jgi:hypothetical protein
MQLTSIRKNYANDSMKAAAFALFPYMEWRHHGIGVLQGYVTETSKPEVRLHVWDPSLLKPGMDVSGDIHDHRFDLVSHVLCGSVGHEEIFPDGADDGEWSMLKLTHARAAKAMNYHGPTEALPGKYHVMRSSIVIPEGFTYTYPASRFHRSPLLGGTAITCVEKHSQSDASARILHPSLVPPVMAFGHDMDWSVIGPVIERARKLLASSLRL